MFNSQFNKLKSGTTNGIEITLKLSSNVVGDFNDENKFLRKLLLTNTQVSKFCKAFANNFSANIKSSKTQLHKIVQWRGFLGRPLVPLLKTGLPLTKLVLRPLVERVLIPLGLTKAAAGTDVSIRKKMFGSGTFFSGLAKRTTLIMSNKETINVMKKS